MSAGPIGGEALKNPVEAVLLGRARAAGRADNRLAAKLAEHQQIAGVDGHAEMAHLTSRSLHGRRDHIPSIRDRGRAEDDDDLRSERERARQRLREVIDLVMDADVADALGASEQLQPFVQNLQRLVDDRCLEAGQHRRDDGDPLAAEGSDRDCALRGRHGARDQRLRRGEWNDLHCRDHLAGADALERRQRRDRDRLVEIVDSIDLRGIDRQHAGALGEEVHAARERLLRHDLDVDDGVRQPFGGDILRADSRADDGVGEPFCGLVLGEIAGLQLRDDHLRDAGGEQRIHVLRHDASALLQHKPAFPEGMGDDAADGRARRNRAEPHAASLRSDATISPMMATAISAGLTAPISRPIGARMRAMEAASKPAAARRSTRFACVFRLPSAPM
jgi:hypothetical protein